MRCLDSSILSSSKLLQQVLLCKWSSPPENVSREYPISLGDCFTEYSTFSGTKSEGVSDPLKNIYNFLKHPSALWEFLRGFPIPSEKPVRDSLWHPIANLPGSCQ